LVISGGSLVGILWGSGRWKLLQTSIANGVEQLAGLRDSLVAAVLYYLGNFPDVFPFCLTACAGSFLHGLFLCMVQ
jgi:hypothetical protein